MKVGSRAVYLVAPLFAAMITQGCVSVHWQDYDSSGDRKPADRIRITTVSGYSFTVPDAEVRPDSVMGYHKNGARFAYGREDIRSVEVGHWRTNYAKTAALILVPVLIITLKPDHHSDNTIDLGL